MAYDEDDLVGSSSLRNVGIHGMNPNDTEILDFSKLRGLADDNSEFDENGKRFSKRIENTVEKRKIARHEQFLLFPHCFQETRSSDTQSNWLFGKGLTRLKNNAHEDD